ncbi:hypothetical protein [Neptunomonas sp.]|uniref:DUF6942 family protein n=1 Tax=Neptunomonas sp. TaxID=1971898 RepID=UPI0035635202
MSTDTSQNQSAGSADHLNDCLGSTTAQIVLYIANRPVLSSAMHRGGVFSAAELISLNGNHWRKILTIFAKLASPDGDWRAYRDHALLHQREAICFSGKLVESATIHLVAGKASWAHLGLDMEEFQPLKESQRIKESQPIKEFQPLDAEQRVWISGNIICTPYFDYRQCPNALIGIVQQRIHKLIDA